MWLFRDAKYNFLAHRRKAYAISGAFLALSLVAALFWQVTAGSWINYGIDFLGGTVVQVEFQEQTSVADIRETIQPVFPGAEITSFGGGETEFLIRAPEYDPQGVAASDQIQALLSDRFGEENYSVERVEAVGAKIGDELQARAAFAILFSFVITLIYLAFRFEWRFGLAAVIATMHDIAVTLGLISIFQIDVSLPTVAAVLTIIGYSLNDTIVVFDRARENLRREGRRADFEAILSRSINETLPRTVITSGTTLAALFSLLVLGGAIIRDFAFILIVGIAVGTYSSIFVASPALRYIQNRWPRRADGRRRSSASRRRAGAKA